MTYDIIATGSAGNAVVINGKILIDCGVPFKRLRQYVPDLKLVLLTHEHGDHFNPAAVRALHRERPALRWGCCEWMIPKLIGAGVSARVIDVLTPGSVSAYISLGLYVIPVPLTHNVENCGYKLSFWNYDNRIHDTLFYATDTGTLDGVKAKYYDLYMIEANHTEAEIAARIVLVRYQLVYREINDTALFRRSVDFQRVMFGCYAFFRLYSVVFSCVLLSQLFLVFNLLAGTSIVAVVIALDLLVLPFAFLLAGVLERAPVILFCCSCHKLCSFQFKAYSLCTSSK